MTLKTNNKLIEEITSIFSTGMDKIIFNVKMQTLDIRWHVGLHYKLQSKVDGNSERYAASVWLRRK